MSEEKQPHGCRPLQLWHLVTTNIQHPKQQSVLAVGINVDSCLDARISLLLWGIYLADVALPSLRANRQKFDLLRQSSAQRTVPQQHSRNFVVCVNPRVFILHLPLTRNLCLRFKQSSVQMYKLMSTSFKRSESCQALFLFRRQKSSTKIASIEDKP